MEEVKQINYGEGTALEKLDKLRERLFLAGKQNHNPELLVIAQELLEIQKMILEEKKKPQESKEQKISSNNCFKQSPSGGIITNRENLEDLDMGFDGGQLGL